MSYEELRYLGFERDKYYKDNSWEHLGTRGGRGIAANLRLAYSSTTSDWGEVLGISG